MSQKPEFPPNVPLIVKLCREFPTLTYMGQIRFADFTLPILVPPESSQTSRAQTDDQLVDLDQIGALVRRAKRTMRRHRKDMPAPTVKSRGSIPDLWYWPNVRPWAAATFGLILPERYPRLD